MTVIKDNGIKYCYRADKGSRFLSQVSRSYLSNLDGEAPSKVKVKRKMPKMQMAAFFGKSLLSQLLHYLESHVWGQNASGTQGNLYSTDSHWGFALGVTQILAFLDTNMLVEVTQNRRIGGLTQHKAPTPVVLHRI